MSGPAMIRRKRNLRVWRGAWKCRGNAGTVSRCLLPGGVGHEFCCCLALIGLSHEGCDRAPCMLMPVPKKSLVEAALGAHCSILNHGGKLGRSSDSLQSWRHAPVAVRSVFWELERERAVA